VRLIYTVAYGLDGRSAFRFERDASPASERTDRRGVYGFPRGSIIRQPRRA